MIQGISPISRWLGSKLPAEPNGDGQVILYFSDFGSSPVKQHYWNGTKFWITQQQSTKLNPRLSQKPVEIYSQWNLEDLQALLASTHNQINHSTLSALILQAGSPEL